MCVCVCVCVLCVVCCVVCVCVSSGEGHFRSKGRGWQKIFLNVHISLKMEDNINPQKFMIELSFSYALL